MQKELDKNQCPKCSNEIAKSEDKLRCGTCFKLFHLRCCNGTYSTREVQKFSKLNFPVIFLCIQYRNLRADKSINLLDHTAEIVKITQHYDGIVKRLNDEIKELKQGQKILDSRIESLSNKYMDNVRKLAVFENENLTLKRKRSSENINKNMMEVLNANNLKISKIIDEKITEFFNQKVATQIEK